MEAEVGVMVNSEVMLTRLVFEADMNGKKQ